MPEPKRRPGDQILDRYTRHLSSEDRELAHERLRALARVLIRIRRRLAAQDIPIADSTHSELDDTIPSLPTS